MADLQAILKTNKGDITVNLFPNHAPRTVQSFVGLATGSPVEVSADGPSGRRRVKDRPAPRRSTTASTFHRIIPGFMIQGGCPQGTGTGGPGYNFDDEPHPELTFDKPYLLAMANAGVQGGKGTNGSQFFITVGATTWLNCKHTIFGEVADQAGRDVVDAIAAVPTGAGRPPGRAGRDRVAPDRRVGLDAPAPGGSGYSTHEMTSNHRAPGRGADLLPAPRPRDLRPLPAMREADLPGLHARRGRGFPVPGLHQGGREDHPPGAGRTADAGPPIRG